MWRSDSESELLEDRIAQVAGRVATAGAIWRPQVTGLTPKDACALCLRHGAAGFVANCLTDLLPFTGAKQTSCLVGLPLTAGDVPLIGQISASTSVLLSVDHFVHAERISAWMGRGGREQLVLVLLQGDQPGAGIRPGQDALQLAQGIARLPGIQVAGVTVSIADEKAADSVIQSAKHTQRLFRESGIDCDVMNVVTETDQTPVGNDGITGYGVRGLIRTSSQPQSSGILTAEVISRPSLDVVVIRLEQVLSEAGTSVRFPEHPKARVLCQHDDCCVLAAHGSAQRLTIGDTVRAELTVV